MDPVGPWSAYASYNRLAGVQTASTGGELHHHLSGVGTTAAVPPTTAPQLLPGSFLTPPPVGYETVFSPLFHHATGKPAAHYVTQHRAQAALAVQASKPSNDGDYHQPQTFFDQSAASWQQTSPFGILPHESVAPSTTKTTTPYENFNAHFAAAQSLNHLNSQLAKTPVTRAQSPQTTTKPFFQVPTTFISTDTNITTKSFSATSPNIQQSCIVTSSSISPTSKDYRLTQSRPFINTISRPLTSSNNKHNNNNNNNNNQIQTKTQTKIYSELPERGRNTEENQNIQAAPISYSIMDVPGRINYNGSNASAKRSTTAFQQTNYRNYNPQQQQQQQPQQQQQQQPGESGYQRTKNTSDYNNTNGSDCSVVIPKRPSPLQAHSQASPLGHVPSPAYPMYNSPINSISSPQQSTNSQITPPSPLDVTIPRPSNTQANVAYPSVITRALNSSDKNCYDRTNCWNERQNSTRKYSTNQSATTPPTNNFNSSNLDITTRADQQARQQTNYFDSATGTNQIVPLQDLSSCRGDPMSLVKNLQQNCQITPLDVKEDVKVNIKRRKSCEKPLTNDASGRIPPPAHSTGMNQQQNGAYFDFDRWNLSSSAPKIFNTQNLHQQHQSLMVPHPHGGHHPPTLPYFTPFLPTSSPSSSSASITEYSQPNVEVLSVSNFNEQNVQSHFPQDDQPKVVVPNIEEELNFLSQTEISKTNSTTITKPIPNSLPLSKSNDKSMNQNSGFMSSYLKFLQGDKDDSPPPTTRSNRKQNNWAKSKQQIEQKNDTNGVIQPIVQSTPPPSPHVTKLQTSQVKMQSIKKLSQGDPQDDPRYFPLPKERSKNSFSSDDGISSDDDFFQTPKKPVNTSCIIKETKPNRKGRPPKTMPVERNNKRSKKNTENKITEIIPKRESSKRAAKEKNNLQKLMKNIDDEPDESVEYQDSDSDPAWTPLAATEEDPDDLPLQIRKNRRTKTRTKRKRNLISTAAKGAGINETDGYGSDSNKKKVKHKNNGPPTLEDNIAASLPNESQNKYVENSYKIGDFVILKSDIRQECPHLWRIDDQNLLKKYEPFSSPSGLILHKNSTTFSPWNSEVKKQYILAPVKFHTQSHNETIVEFLQNELPLLDDSLLEKYMKDFEVYQDNFEVYIQTLISQALDNNFLMEIFQEKDEYFLSNVKIVDDITDSKKKKLLSLLRWPASVQAAVCTWPCFNIITELNPTDINSKSCAACGKKEIFVRVLMYGQPYNSTTLEGCQPDPKAMNEKNFLMCKLCANRVELSNKVTHQKYLMYIECAKRVSEKRAMDPNKDTTCILNELLADEIWLNQLFFIVRTSWTEIDIIEHTLNYENNSVFG